MPNSNAINFCQDLESFKPNIYRIMQISGKPLENGFQSTKLFHAKRNRVEIVADFPENNEAEAISSLLLHPKGWVTVSRNVSADNNSEVFTYSSDLGNIFLSYAFLAGLVIVHFLNVVL